MRFASLGSGSQGNALLIESGGTRVLLDCGFGLSELTSRLSRLDLEAADLDAIIVTHEHGDHGSGV
ncbi:MAG: MBL fold metallo-hydrolase, partial [Burkholderiales bacterium]